MLNQLNRYKRKISFYLRKKVTRKYVIIESDDWGLERAKDEDALSKIVQKYDDRNCTRWTRDALETEEDLDQLFVLFDYFKNKFDQPPIITANFITHNVDQSSKERLKFKPISEGYNYGNAGLFDKYREGFDKKYFIPQLHGYSHYDTSLLEQCFQSDDFVEDFKIGFPLAKSTIKGKLSLYRGECFDPNFSKIIVEAIEVFKTTFGYYSKTFIPPNYLYSDKMNRLLTAHHIELLQSTGQFLSTGGNEVVRPYFRRKKGLLYSIRNARLDTHFHYNCLSEYCIKHIESAFTNKMPAVIDIHRVNFSGKYSPETRLKTLEELNKVFLYLYQKHPESIFISSDALLKVFSQAAI